MFKATFNADLSRFPAYRREVRRRVETASLYATDKAAKLGRSRIAKELRGRLGGALMVESDLQKGKGVYIKGADKFSASGTIRIRPGSERSKGAIISATEGATIVPRTTDWLWIPTPELGIKRIGRKKVTPRLYNQAGYDRRIGPLVKIPGRNPGEALLVIKNVQVKVAGRGRPLRGSRSGIARAGREQKQFIVAFVGIRQAKQVKYVDVPAILNGIRSNELMQFIEEGLKRSAK